MKLVSKNTLLAALLAATSYGAFAADSVDLKVIGTIVPAACTPSIAGGGVIDFGNIPAASLSTTGFTVLPYKQTTLSIACDSAAKVAVTTTDNRSASVVPGIAYAVGQSTVNDTYGYGLGSVNGKNVGSFIIRTSAGNGATADGAAVDRIQSVDSAVTWIKSGGGTQIPGTLEFSWAPTGTTTPAAYTTITQPLEIRAALNSKADLPDLQNEVPLDGLATFTLKYL